MDPWYLKKNFKPSSLRKYPQTAQYTHPRPSNTPPKRTQMLLDSLYMLLNLLALRNIALTFGEFEMERKSFWW